MAYDHSIEWLADAIGRAQIGRTERLAALRRLAAWSPPAVGPRVEGAAIR